MVLTHAAGLPGGGYALHGTHSHIIILELQGEVGGGGGGLECAVV